MCGQWAHWIRDIIFLPQHSVSVSYNFCLFKQIYAKKKKNQSEERKMSHLFSSLQLVKMKKLCMLFWLWEFNLVKYLKRYFVIY